MLDCASLNAYLDELLQPHLFEDYCPNGLQVQGSQTIKTIVTGVTACQALLDAAVAKNADAILVHHGYFWRGESATITGIKYRRIKQLLDNNINLFTYHLPLDAHAEHGNNVQLAKLLGFSITGRLPSNQETDLVFTGVGESTYTGDALSQLLNEKLGRKPLHIAAEKPAIKTIAWCTGAAQSYIEMAANAGADAYITGEVSEPTVHFAREQNIHFYAAGHHATERYGIKCLGDHLAAQFGVEHFFIDIDNPV